MLERRRFTHSPPTEGCQAEGEDGVVVPAHQPAGTAFRSERAFVPESFATNDASQTTLLFKQLRQREIPDTQALRKWILDWSELSSVLAEESARRYVAMTCDTRNKEAADAYEFFVSNIEPVILEETEKLQQKMIAHENLSELENEFGNWFKAVRTDLELFREENIPLETELNLEVQKYQKITGAMSVQYKGETKTMQQMSPFLQIPNRAEREEAWKLLTERRLQDSEVLDIAFQKLFSLRMQIAKNAGYEDYLSYIFKAKHRFDYTPQHCREFHESIEKIILPLQKEILQNRAKKMGLQKLRPWDLVCDPEGRPALKPFKDGAELVSKCGNLFSRLNPQWKEWYGILEKEKLIDADSRLGKAPGGYQITYDESRVPFIFMNAAGINQDVYTLLHESGHSFHQFAMAEQKLFAFRDVPSEFAEVASMSLELLGAADLSDFYSEADFRRSRTDALQDIISLFPWVAIIDAFQHELYVRPNHTAKDREEIWLALQARFDSGIDWAGLEKARSYSWQRQLHLFEVPFYYVEYGIAQLGALQVYANSKKDPSLAVQNLIEAEKLGSSKPLPELFKAANIKFDFSPKTIEPLARMIMDELRIIPIILLILVQMTFSQELVDSTVVADAIVADAIVADTIVADTIAANTAVADTVVIPPDTSSSDSVKIKPGLHFFISVGAQFINFKENAKFQALLDTQFLEFNADYLADTAGHMRPLRQNFQPVNLAFPVTAGIIWQFNDMHSLGLGATFLYDNESIVLTDKDGASHNLKYTLQAFPVFAEYRLQISPDFISLKNGDYFSLFLRYYWMLPPTEIYSSWGSAVADFEPLGNGLGVFLGYRFWEWNGLNIWGELGYLSLDVKSSDEEGVLNSWNLGGISILIRAMF
jgi:oligoendopeptidase F